VPVHALTAYVLLFDLIVLCFYCCIDCSIQAAAESKAALRKALPTTTSTSTSTGLSAEEEETLAEVRTSILIFSISTRLSCNYMCVCMRDRCRQTSVQSHHLVTVVVHAHFQRIYSVHKCCMRSLQPCTCCIRANELANLLHALSIDDH
jgi:hypothetical protein